MIDPNEMMKNKVMDMDMDRIHIYTYIDDIYRESFVVVDDGLMRWFL